MASTGEAATWRLGYRPALDGLRGIAVLLVVLGHVRVPVLGAGAGHVGVTVFFTLSGFLIATLLYQEIEDTRRLSLSRFYERRARRLLPALFSVVLVSIALTLATGIGFVSAPEVVGALTYSTNIIGLFVDLEAAGRMLHHTWSLVIEEQFYLIWPLVVLALWRRRVLLLAIVVFGVGLATAQRFTLLAGGAWDQAVFSIGARADGILIGCALALVLRGRTAPAWGWLSPAGLLCITYFAVTRDYLLTLSVGLLIAAIGTALVILSTLSGGAPRWLSWPPLCSLGRVSYGLYLWHHVVLIFSDRALGFEGDWVATSLVVIPASAVLTALSWRYVEQPFQRRRPSREDLARGVTPAASVSTP